LLLLLKLLWQQSNEESSIALEHSNDKELWPKVLVSTELVRWGGGFKVSVCLQKNEAARKGCA